MITIIRNDGSVKEVNYDININKLYLGYEDIKEIRGLEILTNLQYLYLDHNQITNINGFEKLTNLKELYFYVLIK